MLSVSGMSQGQEGYYLNLAREDYYLNGGEPPGQWYGKGAESLGLFGEVDGNALSNLFQGMSPDGSGALVQIQRRDGVAVHRPGWDLTFSAPKSVSTLWSQCSEEARRVIQDAHLQAVKAALEIMQENAAFSRRGKGGYEQVPAEIAVALFEHSTSRALDPQLHTHALLLNVGLRPNGTYATLNSEKIFDYKMALGTLYRAELASQLQQRLGLEVERVGSWFEVTGVSEGLMEFFSKRREAIETWVKERGEFTAERAAVAAIETRDAKPDVSRAELFAAWSDDGRNFNWGQAQAEHLLGREIAPKPGASVTMEGLDNGAERLAEKQAHFTKANYWHLAAEELQASGLSARQIIDAANDYMTRDEKIVHLGLHYGEERFTTPHMLELEKRLLEQAETMVDLESHQVSAQTLLSTLSKHPELSLEQMQAVQHLTYGTGDLALVSGMAGAGKTTMLAVAKEAWEAEGYDVMGMAIAGRAARQLGESAGIPSDTVAKILHDIEAGTSPIHDRCILVLDEAGMAPTKEFNSVLQAASERGAKLAAIGQRSQLQPIGAGAPFAELEDRYGSAELREIRRQFEPWARDAVTNAEAGDARKVLKEFASRGLLKVEETKRDAITSLVADWEDSGTKPQDTLILAARRDDVRDLNRRIQEVRLANGELGGDGVTTSSGESVFTGDQIIFNKRSRVRGIENGMRAEVLSIDPISEELRVRVDSGDLLSFSLRDYGDVGLGYASTTHRAQGSTTQQTFVLMGGSMQDRELSYVQVSRAREQTHIYSTRSATGDDIATLTREMERSRQKDMAHTVIRQNASEQAYGYDR